MPFDFGRGTGKLCQVEMSLERSSQNRNYPSLPRKTGKQMKCSSGKQMKWVSGGFHEASLPGQLGFQPSEDQFISHEILIKK